MIKKKIYFAIVLFVSIFLINILTISASQFGYWKLNEGNGTIAYDSSGNNNIGTIINGTWINNKLYFNGKSAIVINSSNSLKFIDQDFIVQAIFNATDISQGSTIVEKQDGNNGWGIYIDSGSKHLEFLLYGNKSQLDLFGTTDMTSLLNKNNQITAFRLGNDFRLYLNGNLELSGTGDIGNLDTKTINTDLSASGYLFQPLFIGTNSFSVPSMIGSISEVIIYPQETPTLEYLNQSTSAGKIYNVVTSSGAGLGIVLLYLSKSLPFLLISLGLILVIIVILLSIFNIFKSLIIFKK